MQRVVRSKSYPHSAAGYRSSCVMSIVSLTVADYAFIRLQEQAGVDIYDKKQPSNATGGVQLGPESAAFAAVQRAAALAGPTMIHCDLCNVRPPSLHPQYQAGQCRPRIRQAWSCTAMHSPDDSHVCEVEEYKVSSQRLAEDLLLQANFAGDPQYKAHLEGPVHRKALAKVEAQRQRDLAAWRKQRSCRVCTGVYGLRHHRHIQHLMLGRASPLYSALVAQISNEAGLPGTPCKELLFWLCLGSVMCTCAVRLQRPGRMAAC